jgi:ATP-binding cassette subfamily G (WHITE) protein 1
MDILNRSKQDEFAEDESIHDESVQNRNNEENEYVNADDENENANANVNIVPLEKLATYYKQSDLYHNMLQIIQIRGGPTKGMLRFRARRIKAFRLLLFRDIKNVIRNPMIVRTKLFQTLFLAGFIAAAFWNTKYAPVPAIYQNISGVLFFLITNAFFASFQNVLPVFSIEKPSFAREHSQGYYGTSSYFLAKIIVELPLTVFFPIITAAIVYWSVGLRPGFVHFIVLTVILQLVALTGFSFGLFSASIFNDVAVALALSILILLPFMVMAGLFLNLSTVPKFLQWIAWISPMRYGYALLLANQFDGWDAPGASEYYTNTSVGTGLSNAVNVIILCCLFLAALIGAYFALIRVVMKNEGRSIIGLFRKRKIKMKMVQSGTIALAKISRIQK